MSGLLALLDDVAAIAKLAAAQVDDVAGQAAKVGAKVGATVLDDAAKAGAKAAGVVIDDAAVTPKYVTGLPAARELPIVWKIARASFFNKLVILLPAALLLNAFLPWVVTPLLMLGGAYLCFEGAEKVWHALHPHAESQTQDAQTLDMAHLEEQRVKGAIKTDFILSAEIMTISLAAIESDNWVTAGVVLAVVAVGITTLVYGAVALLVKMDDVGLKLSKVGRLSATRSFGRGMVRYMPTLMTAISVIGTAAMLWVGGNIIVHGLDVLGWHWPYKTIHDIAESVAAAVGTGQGFVAWVVTATLDGILGIFLGLALIPIVTKAIAPFFSGLFPEKQTGAGPHVG
jgi:predicted DNA repair protein MutK